MVVSFSFVVELVVYNLAYLLLESEERRLE